MRVTRRRCASRDAQQTKRSGAELPLSSFGSSRVAARFELLVFAELKIEKTMGKHRLGEHRGVPLMPSPTIGPVITRMWDQSLTIEGNLSSRYFRFEPHRHDPICLNAP